MLSMCFFRMKYACNKNKGIHTFAVGSRVRTCARTVVAVVVLLAQASMLTRIW